MFDVAAYVSHLRYEGSLEPTLETLRALHRKHLESVPFDNSLHAHKGLAVWDEVETDPDVLFEQLITGRRGGVCHELSGLFRTLLQRLGYEVLILSAGIRGADDQYGPDLEHMLNAVRIDGELYLVDVGFVGPSFIEPLHVGEEEQEQNGFRFKVVDEGEHKVVLRQGVAGGWQGVYRFRPQERRLTDWKGFSSTVEKDMEWFWEGEQLTAGTKIQGRTGENGQMILIGRRYVESKDGAEKVRAIIDKNEYQDIVRHILRQAA
ncbi:arylamine N-acetyltransferase [Streptomyces sp. NPDC051315]|uniref:arylamine N-acetyltransferase n=1 Tax=Streptomyces sp. NPDC051315 TaxID=3365650 RepID=UPI0037B650FA